MARLGLGLARNRPLRSPASGPAAPYRPVGFALNGSTNAAVRAMIDRVRSGSGRGRIVMKGDSTTVGQGGGTPDDPRRLTGARANRPAAVLAARLTAAGVPALDGAMVGDNGLGGFVTVPLAVYDPRFDPGAPPWAVMSDQRFAGGGLLQNGAGGVASYRPADAADRFEIVYYNAQDARLEVTIEGGAGTIAAGPVEVAIASGSGFGRVTFKAAPGAQRLRFAGTGGTATVALASIAAWNSAAPAIDTIVDAALGATAADQAMTGNGWCNLDHLTWARPDLTIVNLGLNDMATGVTVETYVAGLRAIIVAARVSGDVLLVSPHPAAPSFAPIDRQVAFQDAAAALAREQGVASLSLFALFGGAFTPALGTRLADGLVHGDAGLYADIGTAYSQALLAMAS